MIKRASFSAWVYLGTVFVAGGVLGAFTDHLYTTKTVLATSAKSGPKNARDYKKRYIEEMQGRLKLNPDQVQKLGVILDETQARMRDVHEKDRPVMAAIHNDQLAKIHTVFNDSQWAEYQRMLAEREARRQAEEKAAK